MQEFISCVKDKYVCFGGRARRREYWMFMLFAYITQFVAGLVDGLLGLPMVLTAIVGLGLLLPAIGVFFRRLHDTGRSGWWWLIGLIPAVGPIVLLVFMCLDSQPGANQYGSNPKGL